MRVADIERLYGYSSWANAKLLTVVTQLPPEQFTQSVAGSYGSIRNTLVHVLSAEWGWLDRCGGPPRGERLKPEDYPTVDAVVEVWRRVETSMRAFLAKLKDEDLARDIAFAIGAGPKMSLPLGELLQHAVIHAVHHRGQVALLLRALGYTPGNFDLLVYASENPSVLA
jgi:uncharacterized damage-inducible protein DinB